VPEVGSDTLFADMYAAYEGLSDQMWRVPIQAHGAIYNFTHVFGRGYAADKLKAMQQKYSLVGASGVANASRDGPQGTVRERRIYH
jgi:taurine dioxygenase